MNRAEAPDECINRRALQEAFNSHCVGECSICAFYGYELLDNGKYFYHCKLIDDAPEVEGKCRNALADIEIEKINNAYEEYCKHDGKKLYHLPFIIWLKYVARIKPSDYYKTEREG